jgi:photosystem II stability/assembly factor-like uncharacterized protein
MSELAILVGTRKGAFLASTTDRKSWRLHGPYCGAWPINHVVHDPRTDTIYAGGGNEWFGPAIWKSTDRGATWTHSSAGLKYAEGETPVKTVWSLAVADNKLYVGVEPAGLFVSDDGGATFRHIEGLTRHPSRPEWQPGGGGLILHHILSHPTDPRRLYVGISSVGVFETTDAGDTWLARNVGVRCDYLPDGMRYPETGQCVHSLAFGAGNPERMYQQNHCGMYRSDDAGRTWISIEAGLPSTFGFPVASHPRDPDTAYLIPLNGDSTGRFMPDAKCAVWCTRDAGRTWTASRTGLPQEHAYFGVLRQAFARDAHDPLGLYFGTSGGRLYASVDDAQSWTTIAEHLPVITSVEVMTPAKVQAQRS